MTRGLAAAVITVFLAITASTLTVACADLDAAHIEIPTPHTYPPPRERR